MNDLRATARAAVNRLSSVVEAREHSAPNLNAALDITQPLMATFDLLIDEIEALKRQVAQLQQTR
jgi:hypothetical protein